MHWPAAWHPDPTGRYEYRYYNGERWTSDVSVGGQRYVDVLADQAGPTPPPGGTLAPRGRAIRGFALASFWVALGSVLVGWLPFVFVVGGGGALTAFVFGVIALRRSSRSEQERSRHARGMATAGIVLSVVAMGASVGGFFFTQAVIREFRAFSDEGPHTVVVDSCVEAGSGLVVMSGTITNLSDRERGYVVTVEYSVLGRQRDRSSADVPNVSPGEARPFQTVGRVADDGPVTCEIGEVTGPTPFDMD